MAYQIFNTDGSLFATIPDGTILGNTSVTLVGKNWAGYGAYLDTNFLHLMQNFSNSTAPGNPQTGQLWWNSSTGVLNAYNGTVWKTFSAATSSTTAPATGNVIGDLWYNPTAQVLYVWNGSTWLAVGPSVSNGTGALTTSILDNLSINHSVIELLVNGDIVGIISEASFTPAVAMAGFASIGAGLTLSSNINGGGTAAGLVGSYVQSYGDISTTGNISATGNITLKNVYGNGVVSTTGNITGNYFFGNGAFLTGISGGGNGGGYGDSNVVSLLASFGSNVVSTTGNVNANAVNTNNVFIGKVNANGSYGTAGQVLTSGGSGAVAYWANASSGGGNVGANGAILLNLNTITADYTFPGGFNGVSSGPLAVAANVTITIPAGSAWSIV